MIINRKMNEEYVQENDIVMRLAGKGLAYPATADSAFNSGGDTNVLVYLSTDHFSKIGPAGGRISGLGLADDLNVALVLPAHGTERPCPDLVSRADIVINSYDPVNGFSHAMDEMAGDRKVHHYGRGDTTRFIEDLMSSGRAA